MNSADAINPAYVKDKGLTVEWLIETNVHRGPHCPPRPIIQQATWRQDRPSARPSPWLQRHLRQGVQRRHRVPARRQPFRRPLSRDVRTATRSVGCVPSAIYSAGPHARLHDAFVIGRAGLLSVTRSCMARWRARRARLPGGTRGTLYDSIQKVLACRRDGGSSCARLRPNGRDIQWETTWPTRSAQHPRRRAASRRKTSSVRTERDRNWTCPRRIIPACR